MNVAAPSHQGLRERFGRLDALRGVAIVWMALFHFCFDLNHFGFIRQNFYSDPFWTVQRTCIVSMFLFCAGFGQAIALDQSRGGSRFTPAFWGRWAPVSYTHLTLPTIYSV